MIENKLDKYLNEQKHFAKFSTETRKLINQFDAGLEKAEGINVYKLQELVDKILDRA